MQKQSETVLGLKYPWGKKADPEAGVPIEVAQGVYWVRFAMPMSLDHINLWLLEDGDGWTIVDTCLAITSAREQWESLFEGFMSRLLLKRTRRLTSITTRRSQASLCTAICANLRQRL